MAKLKTKFSLRQARLPKSTLINTQHWPLGKSVIPTYTLS